MFKNYLKVAIRSLLKQRTYSIINVAGLTVGSPATAALHTSYRGLQAVQTNTRALGAAACSARASVEGPVPVHEVGRRVKAHVCPRAA